METYTRFFETCEGVQELVNLKDGLLWNPITNAAYEAALCPEIQVKDKPFKRFFVSGSRVDFSASSEEVVKELASAYLRRPVEISGSYEL